MIATGSIALRERLQFRPWSPPRLRPVLHLVGRMLLALPAAMLLPAVADLVVRNPDWKAFMLGSGITFACAAELTYLTRCPRRVAPSP